MHVWAVPALVAETHYKQHIMKGITQHNEMCHNAATRSQPASFQFKLPPSPSGRLRGMSNRAIHMMTQYRFAEDPRYLHEILDIVNRLAQEHDEVENIFSGTLTNNVLICIKCCRCFSEDSTPANKQRMRAAWLKLDLSERWVIQKIVVCVAQLLQLDRAACVLCDTLRSQRCNRCCHCKKDTPTRDIAVCDVFQDRR